jgi:hypothetical protein
MAPDDRLVRNLYVDLNFTPGPFGLQHTQTKVTRTVKKGRWYNAKGEFLGIGDLDAEDIVRIRHGLHDGEAFVVLGEFDDGQMNADYSEAPGPEYVLANYRFIIIAGKAYWTCDDGNPRPLEHGGYVFEHITREEACVLLTQMTDLV